MKMALGNRSEYARTRRQELILHKKRVDAQNTERVVWLSDEPYYLSDAECF